MEKRKKLADLPEFDEEKLVERNGFVYTRETHFEYLVNNTCMSIPFTISHLCNKVVESATWTRYHPSVEIWHNRDDQFKEIISAFKKEIEVIEPLVRWSSVAYAGLWDI